MSTTPIPHISFSASTERFSTNFPQWWRTPLTGVITPNSSTSGIKITIYGFAQCPSSLSELNLGLARQTTSQYITPIGPTNNNGFLTLSGGQVFLHFKDQVNFEFIDYPNTTQQCGYVVVMRTKSGEVVIWNDKEAMTTMTLEEIYQ